MNESFNVVIKRRLLKMIRHLYGLFTIELDISEEILSLNKFKA